MLKELGTVRQGVLRGDVVNRLWAHGLGFSLHFIHIWHRILYGDFIRGIGGAVQLLSPPFFSFHFPFFFSFGWGSADPVLRHGVCGDEELMLANKGQTLDSVCMRPVIAYQVQGPDLSCTL